MKFWKWATAGVVGATVGAAGVVLQKKVNDMRGEEKIEGDVDLCNDFEEKHNRLAETIRRQKYGNRRKN